MANELQLGFKSGENLYAIGFRPTDGYVWSATNSAWEVFAAGSWADYDIALSESATGSGYYIEDWSPGTTAGDFHYKIFQRKGATAATTDRHIETRKLAWNGTAATLDTTATASAVELINCALTELGQSTIVSLTEDSENARVGNTFYAHVRDVCLWDHEWNFAVTRATLAASATTPDWGYNYFYPFRSNHLRFLTMDDYNAEFKEEQNGLLTDLTTCQIRYIKRVDDVASMPFPFRDALCTRLAAEMATALTSSTSLRRDLWQLATAKMNQARFLDTQGRDNRINRRSRWLTGRLVTTNRTYTNKP